jgi:hypothetical protein
VCVCLCVCVCGGGGGTKGTVDARALSGRLWDKAPLAPVASHATPYSEVVRAGVGPGFGFENNAKVGVAAPLVDAREKMAQSFTARHAAAACARQSSGDVHFTLEGPESLSDTSVRAYKACARACVNVQRLHSKNSLGFASDGWRASLLSLTVYYTRMAGVHAVTDCLLHSDDWRACCH